MAYTLATFLNDYTLRIANETGTASTTLATNYANEGLRRLRRKFDLPSAEVVTQFALYSGVQRYPVPYTGYKEFVALRDNYFLGDTVFMRNVSEDTFWSQLQTGNTKSESRTGTTRTLLFNLINPATASATLNATITATSDGSWVASGDANTVGSNTLFFRTSTSSFSFNITASSGTATVTNTTQTAKDFSGAAFLNTGMLTPWVYLPSATGFTSMTLRWGSSATKYWTSTVTTQIDGAAFQVGWNQLGFDWLTATSVGSPGTTDAAALTYAQFSMAFPTSIGNQTGILLSDIQIRQRKIFNLHSTTDYLVVDGATGAPKETFTSASDTTSSFNCDPSFVDFLLYEVLMQVFTTHIDDPTALSYYATKLQEAEADLLMRFPSKRQPEVQQYNDTSMHDAWLRR